MFFNPKLLLLKLVLLLLFPAMAIATNPQPAQASGACTHDAIIIGARGSGEGQNEGQPGFEGFGIEASVAAVQAYSDLVSAGYSVHVESVQYPAYGINISWDIFENYFASYFPSMEQGAGELDTMLQSFRTHCPNGGPPVLLFGWSQGAHLIRTMVRWYENPSILDGQIAAVVGIADPLFRNDDVGVKAGTWAYGDGLYFIEEDEPFPDAFANDLYQVCNFNDLVCDGSLGDGHANYTNETLQNAGTWAAARAIDQLMVQSPPGGQPDPGPGTGGFYLPYPNGVSHTVTQAPGDGSHECPGNSCEAIDFAMSLNDPVLASENGTVRQFSTNANHSSGMGRFVMLEHANGLCTVYGHLNSLSSAVTDGDGQISRGQTVGFAGDTGYSFGVHLHFALLNCSSWQSVNVDFVEASNPQQWSSYTSQNSVPDSDGDGIVDPDDECPNEYGTLSNGCALAPGAGRESAESAINNADDVVHLFATAQDGDPYLVWRNPNNWASQWAHPGGMDAPNGVDLIGTPVSVQSSWNATHTFAVGDDGNVYFIWRNSSGIWTTAGWVKPGGQSAPNGITFTGELAASLDNHGTMWLFATADNGNIYALRRDSNGWSNWHLPGGNVRPSGVDLVGTPTAILNSDGVMHVFARGNDGNIYFLWRNGGGSWTSSGWILPAGEAAPPGVDFVEGPVSVVNSWGTTQTFVIGDDGNVYFLWRNSSGSWTTNEWRLPGGNASPAGVNFTDGLSAVMNHDLVVHVFATGDDGNVYILWRNPNRWASEWGFPGGFAAPSGVDFIGKPISVQTSWDATLTFVFGDDGNIYKLFRTWNGLWGDTGWVKPNGINAVGLTLNPWAS